MQKTKIWKAILGVLTSVLLIFNIFSPLQTEAAEVSSAIVGSPNITLSQAGQSGSDIDINSPVKINIRDLVVALTANGVQPNDHIEVPYGTTLFVLPSGNVSETVTVEHNSSPLNIGTVQYYNDKAVITFNSNIETPGLDEVEISLGVDAEFADRDTTGPINIFGVNYNRVKLAGDSRYTITKTGTVNMQTQEITWNVTVKAIDRNNLPVSLAGAKFSDNLANVGTYVSGSFAANGSAVTPEETGSVLSYTFPLGAPDTENLVFKTKLSDADYFGQVEQGDQQTGPNQYVEKNITNTASIFDSNGVEKTRATANVPFTPKWISKYGVPHMDSVDNVGGVYYLSWIITVNEKDTITMTNAKVKDSLPRTGSQTLIFKKAQIQKFENGSWVNVGAPINTEPADKIYNLGTINQPVRVIIASEMPVSPTSIPNKTAFYNTAELTFDEYENNGVVKSSDTADTGDKLLTKRTWPGKDMLEWKNDGLYANFQIEISNLSPLSSPKIYDILFYEHEWNETTRKKKAFDVDNLDLSTLPPAIANPSIRNQLLYDTENFATGMKYVGPTGMITSVEGHLLNLTVHTLKTRSGQEIGQVLEISGYPNTGKQRVNIQLKIVDPRLMYPNDLTVLSTSNSKTAKNSVQNTALLFDNNNLVNHSSTRNNNTNRTFYKEVVPATAIANADGTTKPSSEYVNSVSADKNSGANSAYNYADGSTVYRFSINTDAKNMSTSTIVDHSTLSGALVPLNPTFEEEIPNGWELVPFEDGKMFHLYNGAGTPSGFRATAGTRVTDDSIVNFVQSAGKAIFNFTGTSLNGKSYVMLVRMKPTLETLRKYNNKDTSISSTVTYTDLPVKIARDTNVTTMSVQGTPNIITEKQDFVIKRNLVEKQGLSVGEGSLKWTLEYKGLQSIVQTVGAPTPTLIDKLPNGIELALDPATGQPILSNITIKELIANVDGTFREGATISPNGLVSYNIQTREITFKIQDPSKNYRMTYLTDVVNAGSVTNSVRMVDSTNPALQNTPSDSTISVDNNNVSATARRLGKLTIIKSDDETNRRLSGAKFNLLSADGVTVLRTGTTDSNGLLTFRALYAGTYYLKEIEPPANYNPNTVPIKVVVTKVGNNWNVVINDSTTLTDPHEYNIKNKLIRSNSNIEFKKLDAQTNAPLQNAEFELKNGTTVIQTKSSDSQGLVKFENVPLGEYTITEKTPPTGYVANPATLTVKVEQTSPSVITLADFKNTKIIGSLKITKVDAENPSAKLQGVQFRLEKAGALIGTGTTNQQGELVFNNIEYGDYQLIETATLQGYTLNTTPVPVQIRDDSQVLKTIQNAPNFSNIVIKKADADDANVILEGVVFGLYKADGITPVQHNGANWTATTDSASRAIFVNVPQGNYKVKEESTITGYVLDQTLIDVAVVGNNQTVEATHTNQKIKKTVKFVKVDSEDNSIKIQNARFELRKGSVVVSSSTSNAQGVVEFTGIPFGTYKIFEVAPNPNYSLSPQTLDVTIDENSPNVIELADFTNTKIKKAIKLTKVDFDDQNKALQGVTFELRQGANVVDTKTTDANGVITFTNVATGNYKVVETNTINGYTLNTNEIDVTIDENSDPIVDLGKITNKIKTGTIRITKVDGSDETIKLPYVIFELKQGAVVISTKSTNRNGVLEFSNIPFGDYQLVEKVAPTGYVLNSNPIAISITDQGEIVEKTVRNSKTPITPTITYNLTTSVNGGNGTITPGRTDIPGGTTETVTFNPGTNYEIDYVTVNGLNVTAQVNNNQLLLPIDSNKDVVVKYKAAGSPSTPLPSTFDLITSVDGGNGTISSGRSNIPGGTTEVIRFTPDTNYEIESVTVNGVDVTSQVNNRQLSLTIDSNKNVVVKYKQQGTNPPATAYDLTTSVNGGNGTISSGRTNIPSGTIENIRFTPDANYEIDYVTVNGVNVTSMVNNNELPLVIDENKNVVVKYKTTGSPATPTYDLATSVDGGNGTISASKTDIPGGTTEIVTFIANTGYEIESVILDGVDVTSLLVGNTLDVLINSDKNVVVKYRQQGSTPTLPPPPTVLFDLATSVDGGNGTISSGVTGISSGTTENITFSSDTNYEIDYVTVNGVDVTPQVNNNELPILIDGNKNVVVKYRQQGSTPTPPPTPPAYDLVTAVDGGNGTVSSGRVNIPGGTVEEVIFVPDSNYEIDYVTLNGANVTAAVANNKLVLTIDENKDIVVKYKQSNSTIPASTYDLTTSVDGGNGTISSGRSNIPGGTTENITFTPDTNYEIDYVTVNGVNVTSMVNNNELPLVIDENKNVVVKYKTTGSPATQTYTLTTSVDGGNGTISQGRTNIPAGTTKIVTFIANIGYEIESVILDGVDVTGSLVGNTLSVPINSDRNVVVKYRQQGSTPPPPVTNFDLITSVVGTGGTVTHGRTNIPSGTVETITFSPDTNYEIDYVTVNGVNITSLVSNNQLSVLIDSNKNVVVKYRQIGSTPTPPPPSSLTYTLTTSVNGGNGTISPGRTNIPGGANEIIRFNPDTNYIIEYVTVNGVNITSAITNNEISLLIDENKDVIVRYKQLTQPFDDIAEEYDDVIPPIDYPTIVPTDKGNTPSIDTGDDKTKDNDKNENTDKTTKGGKRKAPKTGDNLQIIGYAAMAGLSAMLLAKKRRKNKNSK